MSAAYRCPWCDTQIQVTPYSGTGHITCPSCRGDVPIIEEHTTTDWTIDAQHRSKLLDNDETHNHALQGERDRDSVLFQSAYGAVPRFMLYGALPFLLIATSTLFVLAVRFNRGFPIHHIPLSPKTVAYVVCPLLWFTCAGIIGFEIYYRRCPRRVIVTTRRLILPRRALSMQEVEIHWTDLEASMSRVHLELFEAYGIDFVDRRLGTKATIASLLFRRFDDFATLALIVGERLGEDWSIKGFLPGTIRGNPGQPIA